MPIVKYPIIVNTSTTIESQYDTYYFNATVGSTTYTLTLPTNSCDGMHFLIYRLDTDNTIILQISGTNIYYLDYTTPTSIIYPETYSVMMMISHNGNWYAQSRKLETFNGIPIFSSSFVANNGSPYYTFSGNGSTTLIATFSYPGSYLTVINQAYFLIGKNAGTTLNIQLVLRDELGNDIYSTGLLGITADPELVTFIPSLINPLPTTFVSLQIWLIIDASSSNNAKLAFYSSRIV
jgi:hypothetical protein